MANLPPKDASQGRAGPDPPLNRGSTAGQWGESDVSEVGECQRTVPPHPVLPSSRENGEPLCLPQGSARLLAAGELLAQETAHSEGAPVSDTEVDSLAPGFLHGVSGCHEEDPGGERAAPFDAVPSCQPPADPDEGGQPPHGDLPHEAHHVARIHQHHRGRPSLTPSFAVP